MMAPPVTGGLPSPRGSLDAGTTREAELVIVEELVIVASSAELGSNKRDDDDDDNDVPFTPPRCEDDNATV